MKAMTAASGHSSCTLIPIMDEVSMMGNNIGLSPGDTMIQAQIQENSARALALVIYLPAQFLEANITIQKQSGFEKRLKRCLTFYY